MPRSSIDEYLEKHLSEKRRKHTYGVRDEILKLAQRWSISAEKAELAALCHDFFRTEERENNLTHGPKAADYLEHNYEKLGLSRDQIQRDLLNAICYHTTGRAHMSELEKILFLADAIEPNRTYGKVEMLRKLAYEDLDKACLETLRATVDYLKIQGIEPDEDTCQAINWMINEVSANK